MDFNLELLDTPQPASKAESMAMMIEVVNIALYGDEDPWNTDSLFSANDAVAVDDIEKGYQAEAKSKKTGNKILCKYDPRVRELLMNGSGGEQVRIVSLVMNEKTYDFFASTTEYHDDDVLATLFDLLENNLGEEAVEVARLLDLAALPDDLTIAVYENLPTQGTSLRSLGNLGLQFSKLLDDVARTAIVAKAEGSLIEAELEDSARDLELGLGATTIDGRVARELTRLLHEEFEPIVRY